MNKKFLSAILFGALMVTSTGTFVSCKDYDDDIDNLNSRVDAIESQIEDLQAQIDAGKWITSVTTTTSGLTITLSDGTSYDVTNGADGTDGVDGVDGTQWTITDDGYWACDGVATDVKAVGEKGEQGESGVKYENGVWKLWNGTEYVEFTGSGSASDKTPYCYTDPEDPNYTILVVYTESGEKTELRLPMNEGLAQITLLDEYMDADVDIEVGYGIRKSSDTWEGDKTLPAVGEYMVATNFNALYVQVTPSNYDLTALDLKLVNGEGKEAPIEIGTPTPYSFSRATSTSGVYMIPIEVKSIEGNEDVIDVYGGNGGARVSLYANESVRSTYSSTLEMQKLSSSNLGSNFYQVKYLVGYSFIVAGSDAEVVPSIYKESQAKFVYDSYLELEGSETNLANALKWGISFDGMTVKSNSSANGTLKLIAHYVDVLGKVYTQKNLTVKYGTETETETVDYGSVTHTIAFQNNPSTLVSLDEYFKDMTANERTLWNASHSLVVGDVDFAYVDADNSDQAGSLSGFVTISNNESTSASGLTDADELKKLENLKLTFDYTKAFDSNNNGADLFSYDTEYTLTVYVYDEGNMVQQIKIPFTIEQPSNEVVAAQYAFNSAYDADKNAFVVKGTTATLANLITVSSTGNNNGASVDVSGATKPAGVTTSDYSVSGGVVTLNNLNKYGTAYAVAGTYVVYKNHYFGIPTFNVIFEKSVVGVYSFDLSTDLSIVSGGNDVRIKIGDFTTGENSDASEYDAALNLYDAAGNKLRLENITVTGVTLTSNSNLVNVTSNLSGDDLTSINLQVAQAPEVDTTVSATITFEDADGNTQTTTANVIVTVKAI